ncbi:VOC family protein [Iodidimonas gelatinilytica]|uniref:VOC family protein n=2 Tax=Iodidimonas gelatinilytica TaxID=1236966 RepID=A0A5A7MQN9_9PROT|nr:VOC family protein [Iodidimonas gelatinilytica]
MNILSYQQLGRADMLNIYLTFDGNAKAAFDFYKSVFGGEFSEFATFAEAPADMNVPDSYKNRVMHVSLAIGDSTLMASDHVPGCGPALVKGNDFAISITGKSKDHCDTLFAKLSEGGEVKMPLDETFWGAYFGMWTDQFGINWMINYQLPQD